MAAKKQAAKEAIRGEASSVLAPLAVSDVALKRVLERHGRALAHMRERQNAHRFGLVLGSGVTSDLGFPKWQELLNRIAKDSRVGGHHLLKQRGGRQSSQAQTLYQHFRSKSGAAPVSDELGRFEMEVRAKWQVVVRDCLYKKVPLELSELLHPDRYLRNFIPLLRRLPLSKRPTYPC